MRKEAAQCELEGPRITGPMTSLNMLGYVLKSLEILELSLRYKILFLIVTFLLAQKSNQKRAPESDYIPDSGLFPD